VTHPRSSPRVDLVRHAGAVGGDFSRGCVGQCFPDDESLSSEQTVAEAIILRYPETHIL